MVRASVKHLIHRSKIHLCNEFEGGYMFHDIRSLGKHLLLIMLQHLSSYAIRNDALLICWHLRGVFTPMPTPP
uniref:Uncharacterized protein n=1 Tax=Arundo donax TaxID=35708 RepID=A0A0A9AWT7_ARUDO